MDEIISLDEVIDEEVNSSTGLTEEEASLIEAALVEAHESDNRETLPLNSPTLLINESTSRFSSAVWFEEIKNQSIVLAGLGGIGSYVAFLLGRLRVNNILLYDNDLVDNTNLSGQLFSIKDIGNPKVNSVTSKLREFSNYHSAYAFQQRYTSISESGDIMICGFDNMAARKVFFENWKNHVMNIPEEERKDCLFIDGRLAAEEFQVFCIKGTDTFLMDKYEREWLFEDSEAEETICSYKQTSFCANMIASVMINLFVNFIANKCNPLIERELPFYTSYDAERMYLKTEMA